jgi:hypothetical protein
MMEATMRLTDDELRDVLERAEEIQRTSRSGEEMRAELEAVIGAGEGVGLTRAAVERALREHLDLGPPPVVGDRVFARSADGRYYLKLSDRWGSSTTCHVSDVWIEPERRPNDRALRKRASATLIGLGAGLGALVGSLITALIMW